MAKSAQDMNCTKEKAPLFTTLKIKMYLGFRLSAFPYSQRKQLKFSESEKNKLEKDMIRLCYHWLYLSVSLTHTHQC